MGDWNQSGGGYSQQGFDYSQQRNQPQNRKQTPYNQHSGYNARPNNQNSGYNAHSGYSQQATNNSQNSGYNAHSGYSQLAPTRSQNSGYNAHSGFSQQAPTRNQNSGYNAHSGFAQRDSQPPRDNYNQQGNYQRDNFSSNRGRRGKFNRNDYSGGRKGWRDTYGAGEADGTAGQTVYPVQSRTQSGTFTQHDYKTSQFKETYGLPQLPKEKKSKKKKKQPDPEELDDYSDDDSYRDPNAPKEDPRKNKKGLLERTEVGSFDDFRNPPENPGDSEADKARKEREYNEVKMLPVMDNSGMSGKAKWGKKKKRLLKETLNMPMAPVMFAKAGILGDKALEKKEETPKEEMSEFEKKEKIEKLKSNISRAHADYELWRSDYAEWFKDFIESDGHNNGKDCVEFLKDVEETGVNQSFITTTYAAPLRRFYLNYKIVTGKQKKAMNELDQFIYTPEELQERRMKEHEEAERNKMEAELAKQKEKNARFEAEMNRMVESQRNASNRSRSRSRSKERKYHKYSRRLSRSRSRERY